jgi:hypothetical protein
MLVAEQPVRERRLADARRAEQADRPPSPQIARRVRLLNSIVELQKSWLAFCCSYPTGNKREVEMPLDLALLPRWDRQHRLGAFPLLNSTVRIKAL